MSRVKIPKNPDLLLTLIGTITTKETALGPNSNLSAAELTELQGYKTSATADNIAQKDLARQAEEKTVSRNTALGIKKGQKVTQPGNASYLVAKLRDLLLAKNKTNANVLGQWGFTVDNSPQGGGETPPA